jgi:hypothetical protein
VKTVGRSSDGLQSVFKDQLKQETLTNLPTQLQIANTRQHKCCQRAFVFQDVSTTILIEEYQTRDRSACRQRDINA